jgi:hypothetical protein
MIDMSRGPREVTRRREREGVSKIKVTSNRSSQTWRLILNKIMQKHLVFLRLFLVILYKTVFLHCVFDLVRGFVSVKD